MTIALPTASSVSGESAMPTARPLAAKVAERHACERTPSARAVASPRHERPPRERLGDLRRAPAQGARRQTREGRGAARAREHEEPSDRDGRHAERDEHAHETEALEEPERQEQETHGRHAHEADELLDEDHGAARRVVPGAPTHVPEAVAVEPGGGRCERAEEATHEERAEEDLEGLRDPARAEKDAPAQHAGRDRREMQDDRREDPHRCEVRGALEQRVDAVAHEHLTQEPAEEAERHRGLHGEEHPAASGLGVLGRLRLGHALRISSARRAVKFEGRAAGWGAPLRSVPSCATALVSANARRPFELLPETGKSADLRYAVLDRRER